MDSVSESYEELRAEMEAIAALMRRVTALKNLFTSEDSPLYNCPKSS